MNTAINQLLDYGLKHHMIESEDVSFTANSLLSLFGLTSFEREEAPEKDLYSILDEMLAYAVQEGLCEDTITDKDLFDTKIMALLMPRPSEVQHHFEALYKENPKSATDWYYDLSICSNYIRKSRTDKNIVFTGRSKYAPIQMSINLSKPEKDPKEIAKAKLVKASGYPKCLLCKENVGFEGNANHPARQNHRIIDLSLKNGKYALQYSPYVYYNEHCIILNQEHVPMKIDRATFENLFEFVHQFPHYMAGSNTDIPIVGGSILTHDHYQGGRHHFPIEDAKIIECYQKNGIEAQMLCWPLSTIRLVSKDRASLVDESERILKAWIDYEDAKRNILPYTNEERHNAITPIVRQKDGLYQIDLVLRNNRCTSEYPDGIFHPHKEHHHVKKENIGLIEVMGLAILPARLKTELELIKAVLKNETSIEAHDELEKHSDWIGQLEKEYTPDQDLDAFMQQALTDKFVCVLENAGVFKMDEDGIAGFKAFMKEIGYKK
jgi:UDPglucose--hexose-1-phosphate uridylyltransferase